ncbi:multicopper oxidase-domain-containing protein, partial [Sphaerosporella brunnea]
VNGVTQCPIKPGESYTYEFQVTQYGHSWYHRSVSSASCHCLPQLTKQKPLLVTMPFALRSGIFPCQGSDVDPSSNCSGRGGSRFEAVVQKGKKYLLRIVNTSADMQYKFSIDNHMLEVVQTDFVPIHPYETDSISIGIGQRYTLVVTANPNSTAPFPPAPEDGNFWIRTIPLAHCGKLRPGLWPTYGILRYSPDGYSPAVLSDPVSKPYDLDYYNATNPPECVDKPPDQSHPIVPWFVGKNPVDTQELIVAVDENVTHGFQRWEVGGEPMWLDWGNPVIVNLENTTCNPEYDVIVENHRQVWPFFDWVYFIIQGTCAFNSTTHPEQREIRAAHPIHLHGHDFAILAQGHGEWDALDPKPKLNFNNPLRRDVALLDSTGYLVIAFRIDNPGVWLMHCHIAWHASSGLASQIVERQREIRTTIRNEQQIQETCWDWRNYTKTVDTFQDDSGV